MRRATQLTEFTATPINLADFRKGVVWKSFPLPIKLALLHIRRVEREPPFSSAAAASPPRPTP